MSIYTNFFGWVRSWSLGEKDGRQDVAPSSQLIEGTPIIGPDGALQLSAVWGCVERIAKTISTLPLMVYQNSNGMRTVARDVLLWQLLHESPNIRMTPVEFWTALLLNLLLRGNGYARIERNGSGEAVALWPMPADQVEMQVLQDGSTVYLYRIGQDILVLAAENVLHLKEMGNGTIGLARLDYMRATTSEAANAQNAANKLFANGGKPTGVLMVDRVLNKEQREAIQRNFSEMATGTSSRLYVLEAAMKYEQINLSPEDMQLLTTRQFTVEEICRWFGVPPVLVGHSNVTTWGSGIEQIVEGFYKFTIRPGLVNIEQAIRKRVMTPAQRARYTVEFNFEGLLRANIKDRMEVYAQAVQNGLKTRNECRQLENDPPIAGGDMLTAQVNLVPLDMLGTLATATTSPGDGNDDNSKAMRRIEMELSETKGELKLLRQQPKEQPHPITVNVAPAEVKVDNNMPSNPITVNVAPAEVRNEITTPAPIVNIEPAEVRVEATMPATEATVVNVNVEAVMPDEMKMAVTSMPSRQTVSSVKRNSAGDIISTTQTETDA